MLYAVIGIFSLAAVLGAYLLSFVLREKETPKAIAVLHGVAAASALILLIVHSIKHPPAIVESLVAFALAALGGFWLLYRDLTAQKIPKWLAVGHGLLALSGYLFLWVRLL